MCFFSYVNNIYIYIYILSLSLSLSLSLTHTHTHKHVYIYIYIYEGGREGEREGGERKRAITSNDTAMTFELRDDLLRSNVPAVYLLVLCVCGTNS